MTTHDIVLIHKADQSFGSITIDACTDTVVLTVWDGEQGSAQARLELTPETARRLAASLLDAGAQVADE